MYNIIRLNRLGNIEFFSISNRRWQQAKPKSVIRLLAISALKTMMDKTAFSNLPGEIDTVITYVVKDISTASYSESEQYFDKNSETKRVFTTIVETSN